MVTARRSWTCWLTRLVALLVLLWGPWPALGQADLYGPSAPADAAWVRAINAEAPGGLGIRVADGDLVSVAFADATAYRAVMPGEVTVDLGGVITTIDVEAGAFVTLVATADGARSIRDTPLVDVSRGLLALYNLTDGPALDLIVADGPVVLAEVAPWSQAAVAVAEAEVELEVRAGDVTVERLEAQLYERGVAHAVIVVEGSDGPLVRYVAAVATE